MKDNSISKGQHNCPCCGEDMPKAEHYKGLFVFQMGKCDKCGAELVSTFGAINDKIEPQYQFYWQALKNLKKQPVGEKPDAWAVYRGSIELDECEYFKPEAVFRSYKKAENFAKSNWAEYTIASIECEPFK